MKTTTMVWKDGKWNRELTGIKNNKKTLILVFGNDVRAVKDLHENFNESNMIGSSSSGQILDSSLVNETVATFIELDNTDLKIVSKEKLNYDNSFDYGQDLMKQLNEEDKLKGIFLFSEGLDVNGAKLAEGMDSENIQKAKIGGGTAGDNLAFEKTWVYYNGQVLDNTAIAVGFYGDDICFEIGSDTGVSVIGVEKEITDSEKNVLKSLDGRPALDVYLEWFKGFDLDELKQILLQCPVEISENFKKEDGLLRTPIDFCEKERTITYTGEIPKGKKLRMMRADVDKLIEAGESAIKTNWNKISKAIINEKEVVNFLVSCSARKAVLSTEVEDEFFEGGEMISGTKTRQIGFYSYGEFTSINKEKSVEFVNQTMTVVSFYEK